MQRRLPLAPLGLAALSVSSLAFGQGVNECTDSLLLPGTSTVQQYITVCDSLIQIHPLYSPLEIDEASSAAPAADVTGDLRPDLFAVIDGIPVVCSAPGVIGSTVELPLGGAAFSAETPAMIPASDAGVGTPVASMDYGLCTWSYASGSDLWTANPIAGTQAWSYATSLDVANVNDEATMEIVGVFSDSPTKSTVRVASLSDNTLTNEVARVFTAPSLTLVLVDYDAAEPGDEIVLTTGNRVFVFDGLLQRVLGYWPVNGDIDCATAVNDALGGGVAISYVSGGETYVQLLRQAGAETPVQVHEAVIAMASVPQGLSGSGSLVAYLPNSVVTFPNQTEFSHEAFNAGYTNHYDRLNSLLTAGADIQPWVVVADFDNDGDADVVQHNNSELVEFESTSMVGALNGMIVPEALTSAMLYSPDGETPDFGFVPAGAQAGDTVDVEVDLWNVYGGSGSQMSHLEVTLYRNRDGVVGAPIDPFSLSTSSGGQLTVTVPVPVVDANAPTYAVAYIRTIGYDPATSTTFATGSDMRLLISLRASENNFGVVPSGVTPLPPTPPEQSPPGSE